MHARPALALTASLAFGGLTAAVPVTDGVVKTADIRARDTTTTIDAKSNWGTWEGWGISLAWWAKAFGDRDDLADILFTLDSTQFAGVSLPGLGFNIARHNAGASSWNTYDSTAMTASANIKSSRQIEGHWLDWASTDPSSSSWDWSVDANQRAMLSKAKSRGANHLELFSNSPMWWMCQNKNPSGASGGGENIQSWNLQDHAVYMATIAKYAKDNWGITFESVDPFNEPTADWWKADGTQEGSHFDVSTQTTVINNLRSELDSRGLESTIVAAADESYYDQATAAANGWSSAARANVARINVHGYQYGSGKRDALYDVANSNGKKLWNSEYGESDATGARLASNLLLDFRWLKPTAWVYWQAIDGGGWGLIDGNNDDKTLGSPGQKYWVLAQFSRHIREGMTILDGGSGSTVAAYDGANRKLVIAYYNSGAAQTVSFELSGFGGRPASGTKVARWRTAVASSGDRYVQDTGATISGTKLQSPFASNTVQTFEVEGVTL
ncbi:Endo-beta-1 6-galactanase [Eutypa lata]|nr:Endo-beta-1 6-galactanase [Eutypa lata]